VPRHPRRGSSLGFEECDGARLQPGDLSLKLLNVEISIFKPLGCQLEAMDFGVELRLPGQRIVNPGDSMADRLLFAQLGGKAL